MQSAINFNQLPNTQLVACAAASKNEFVEVKFELFDLCENYALDGCQRPVPVDGEGSKGVIPYPVCVCDCMCV